MTYLPDVNVWIALVVGSHQHTAAATRWLEKTLDDGEAVAFCRVTQHGFLRLLTNKTLMRDDVLTAGQAWELYETWSRPLEARLVSEPPGLERAWRSATTRAKGGKNVWTDAYLAAFALTAGYTVVTFDRGFEQYEVELRLLT